MMILPTGQVLYADGNGLPYIAIYTPHAASIPLSWLPNITSSPSQVTHGTADYQISGTQLNGLTQASAYGDDFQNATNYPLVLITNSATGHHFFCPAHDPTSMSIALGNPVTVQFDVPSGIETGPSQLQVVANGVASTAVSITVN